MEKATLNGIELEYDMKGSGEPLLLISTGPIADSFQPLRSEGALAGKYRLITYRQRRPASDGPSPTPVPFEEHAADAAALLRHLGVRRAHVAGHSTGASIALQLAVEAPQLVHTLALLEPPLMGVPSAGAFFERAGPALEAYSAGDHEAAMRGFLVVASGLDWPTCRAAVERHVPGGVAEAVKAADNFFASYLPALGAWQFGPEQAATITGPVLSLWGTDTERFFAEGHELLQAWFPQLESCTIEGIAHLLPMQRPAPVARGIADFLGRHPMTDN
ncbi:MAG TPA: alpha/beta hydrolase [Gemmatimonadales bacterium]|nr:alpha/beta hydrolase [Gemmatimonadales bacterium]